MDVLDKDKVKEVIDFMVDNRILVYEHNGLKLQLSHEAFMMNKKPMPVPEAKEKKQEKDDLEEFIFGKKEISSKELGEMYGI